ncbi:hypothetical protein M8J77_011899 [Diaphorina citri]|nr:hypothetical protein M8J77_011899 [Diaphorina citri]
MSCAKPTPPFLLLQPEKEPIKFNVDLDGAPEELIQLVQSIKEKVLNTSLSSHGVVVTVLALHVGDPV